MNTDSVPNTPLAQAILKALVDSRAGRNYYDDTRLLLKVLEPFVRDGAWMPDLRTPEFWERYRPAQDSGFTSNVRHGSRPRPGEIWLEAWHEFFNVWLILPGKKARRVYSAKAEHIGDVWPLEGGAPFGTMTFEYARCIQPYGEAVPEPPECLGYRLASGQSTPVETPAAKCRIYDTQCINPVACRIEDRSAPCRAGDPDVVPLVEPAAAVPAPGAGEMTLWSAIEEARRGQAVEWQPIGCDWAAFDVAGLYSPRELGHANFRLKPQPSPAPRPRVAGMVEAVTLLRLIFGGLVCLARGHYWQFDVSQQLHTWCLRCHRPHTDGGRP